MAWPSLVGGLTAVVDSMHSAWLMMLSLAADKSEEFLSFLPS